MTSVSSIVSHDPKFRRLWMFPRNVRKIEPWKVAQQLSFLEPLKGAKWSGNQALQNDFRQQLVSIGIVRDFGPYVDNSGGPRTYAAQMRSLGLIYFTENGEVEFTLAGDDICDTGIPLPILQHQLLNLQYPSPYSYGVQVRIHPSIRVKPFLFILGLLKRSEISSLTSDEMAVAVIYGHNHACADICVKKILQLRAGRSLKDILDNPYEDLYTPRTAENAIDLRIIDVLTIANTCKNYMESCLLIVPKEQDNGRYIFNPDIEAAYTDALEHAEEFIPNPEREEGFQRAYGAWNRQKDTRRRAVPNANASILKESFIKASFYEYCGSNLVTEITEPLIASVLNKIGGSKEAVVSVIEKLLPRSLDIFEARYLELAVGGAPAASEFEKTTVNLIRTGLALKADWIGSKRKGHDEKGAFTDIVIISPSGDSCAIADAKAVSRYNLPSADYAKMVANYIPNYTQIAPNTRLNCCMYIAGGFSDTFAGEARKLFRDTAVACSGLRASTLLRFAKKSVPVAESWRLFSNTGVICDL